MPTEIARKWGQITVSLPGGKSVPIRVITEITFRDAVDRGQETTFTIKNQIDSSKSNRDVHVATISGESGGSIDVERIDIFRVLDPVARGQQVYNKLDNTTFNAGGPPYFTTHLKTHVTKAHSDDGQSYISREWIDETIVLDPVNRGQETHYYITGNPKTDGDDVVDPNDPDVSGGVTEGSGGSPVRVDWFENIVGFKRGDGGGSGNVFVWIPVFGLANVGTFYAGFGPGIGGWRNSPETLFDPVDGPEPQPDPWTLTGAIGSNEEISASAHNGLSQLLISDNGSFGGANWIVSGLPGNQTGGSDDDGQDYGGVLGACSVTASGLSVVAKAGAGPIAGYWHFNAGIQGLPTGSVNFSTLTANYGSVTITDPFDPTRTFSASRLVQTSSVSELYGASGRFSLQFDITF